MHARRFLFVAFAILVDIIIAEEGALYLQNTILGLKNQNAEFINTRRSSPQTSTSTPVDRVFTQESVPSLHLTKAELASLYQSAVSKGETIKLDPGNGHPHHINAAVHELDPSETTHHHTKGEKDAGYYYYYYPLKSFMDELTSTPSQQHHQHPHHEEEVKLQHYHHHTKHHDDPKSYIHSHTHQHNVHIEPMKNMMDMDKKGKGLEPLFMAISGFIGMTIMFILSILVLPRFDKLKPKGFHNRGAEMTSITRIALEAIEGKDCAERLACEAGKAMNALNLYDNRFVKLVRRMGPTTLGKRIDAIGKYTDAKYKCAAIQCKKKNFTPKAKEEKAHRKPKIISFS